MIASSARPTITPGGIHELTRRWEVDDPNANVLIVHGISEHSGRFEHVGSWLAERGFSAEAFDLIGCGATGGRRADIEAWTDLLDQIQSHLVPLIESPLPVVLLGHSLGACLVTEYLESERPQPDMAVLSAPAVGAFAWQRALKKLLKPLGGAVRISTFIKGEHLSRDPAVGEAYFSDPLVYTKPTIRFVSSFFEAQDRAGAHVDRITVPTLVLHGAADPSVAVGVSEVFESVPVAERRTYPDLRHELFNEPEGRQIVDEVADWIDSQLRSD